MSNYSSNLFDLNSQVITRTLRATTIVPLVKYFSTGYFFASYYDNVNNYGKNCYYDLAATEITCADCTSTFYERLSNGMIIVACQWYTTYFFYRTHYIDHDILPNTNTNGKQTYIKMLNTPDWIASSDLSGYIYIVNYRTQAILNTFSDTTNVLIHLEKVPQNDNLLLTMASDNFVKVRRISDGSVIYSFNTQIVTSKVMKLIANDILVVGGVSNQVKFLKVDSVNGALSSFTALNISGTVANAISFTYNCLILVGTDVGLEIYDMKTFKLVKTATFTPSVYIVNMDTYGKIRKKCTHSKS